jgi:hypothetical protein
MKKYILIALMLMIVPCMASANCMDSDNHPTCGGGHVWEGEFIEEEIINEGTEDEEIIQAHWEGDCVEKEPEVEEVKSSGISWLNYVQKISYTQFWNRSISWLSTHFVKGKVICSRESNLFPLDMFGHPFDGSYTEYKLADMPLNSENTMQGTAYGYKDAILIEGDGGKWTYNTIELPFWMSGKYFCRTISILGNNEFISQEFEIEL